MNKFLLLLFLLVSLTSFGQVATYTFTNADPGTELYKAVTSTDPNITATDITRGTGITSMTGTGSINSNGWNSASQDANDYYEFTLTPNNGYQLNLTAIALSVQRSSSGPLNYLVAYNLGGGTDVTITSGTIPTANVSQLVNANFTLKTPLAVRFRIYAWGATGASGTFRLNQSLSVIGAAPLPVKFTSFTGQSSTNTVLLNWTTSWEEENEGFVILRSKSAKNFEKVGFVEGQITTQELSTYSFTDTDVQEGQLYYYQLRQRDVGGSSVLSNMIAVRVGPVSEESQSFVYPNPNQGNFTLSAKGMDISNIHLYNSAGVEIPITINKTHESANLSIDAAAPRGLYHLQRRTTDGSYQQPLTIIIH
jgi:hypothetical protein